MKAKSFDGLSLIDLAAINNAIAKKHPDDVKSVSRFRSKDDALATLRTVTQTTGERVVRFLRPDYVKRGKAAPRFAMYKDGMLASDYVDKCVKAGHPRGEAVRDLRYDHNLGLIRLV